MVKSIIVLLLVGCSGSFNQDPKTALCQNYNNTKICLETKEKIVSHDKPDVMLKVVIKINY